MRLLLSLIPLYFKHVQANPGTLLTRFYGVHRLTPIIGRQVGAGSAAFCGSCGRTVVDRRVGCAAAVLQPSPPLGHLHRTDNDWLTAGACRAFYFLPAALPPARRCASL